MPTGTCNTIFTKYQSRELFYVNENYEWYYACTLIEPPAGSCNDTVHGVSCPVGSTDDSPYPCNFDTTEPLCIPYEDPVEDDEEPMYFAQFDQPVLQTFLMFCGELLCLGAYGVSVYLDQRRGVVNKENVSGLVGCVENADANAGKNVAN